ncbi:MAG: hypothetical protein ACM3X6_03475 [Patescibacteria group bacterium]
MSNEELTVALENAQRQIESLRNELASFKQSVREHRHEYHTNLMSDKFLTRAFAVLGHYMVAGLIVAAPFYIIAIIIGIIAGIAGSIH